MNGISSARKPARKRTIPVQVQDIGRIYQRGDQQQRRPGIGKGQEARRPGGGDKSRGWRRRGCRRCGLVARDRREDALPAAPVVPRRLPDQLQKQGQRVRSARRQRILLRSIPAC
ncbi:hypothetical protein C725_1431 [Pacificimonas flava]|uniref:Uncharacterized protein n=1 Tax=Pacificimonas flava TaxID=1234595 RepID=M2SDT7_9SPHN|nr:hypothetical protein C725_1431 [Pacificimonas flava]